MDPVDTKFHDLFAAHATKKVTQWPDAPERLRPTLDAWCTYTGFKPQAKKHQERYLAGASDWVAQYGEDATELLTKTMSWLDKHNYRPATPKGCILAAEKFVNRDVEEDTEESRKRYMESYERFLNE